MAEGWNELVQEGFTPDGDGVSPVKPDNEVLFAVSDDNDVVGVLAYALDAPANAYDVTLAYVEPSSRKRGVFKALIAQLQKLAREDRVRPHRAASRRRERAVPGRPAASEPSRRIGGL